MPPGPRGRGARSAVRRANDPSGASGASGDSVASSARAASEIILNFLMSFFMIFSTDAQPSDAYINTTRMMKTYGKSIAFKGQWREKIFEIPLHLLKLGVTSEEISYDENMFWFTVLPNFPNVYNEKQVAKVKRAYQKMKGGYPSYPPFNDVFCFLCATPPGNVNSNVENYLTGRFVPTIPRIEDFLPGNFELKASPKEVGEEVNFTDKQKAEIANLGLKIFMFNNPRVIRPICERSVWPAPPTPWGLGNKAKTVVYLNIQLSQMVHSPIEVCRSCHATSSNMPEFVRNLGDLGPNLLSYPRGKKNEEKYLRFSCSFCHEWISWMSISTKCRQLRSQFPKLPHHLIEDMLSLMVQMFDASVKAAIMTQFPPKECYSCNDLTPYDDQKHDECINTHSSCICMGPECEGKRRELRTAERETGKVERHLHSCNICNEPHDDTPIGRYLKEVPKTHQVGFCKECGDLYHQPLSCGADEIPPICQPCTDKTLKVCRCPACGLPYEREYGCDLIRCGCDHSGQNITMNGNPVGCGQAFCHICGAEFDPDDGINDWTCTGNCADDRKRQRERQGQYYEEPYISEDEDNGYDYWGYDTYPRLYEDYSSPQRMRSRLPRPPRSHPREPAFSEPAPLDEDYSSPPRMRSRLSRTGGDAFPNAAPLNGDALAEFLSCVMI